MKKTLFILVAILGLFLLTGCGSKDDDNTEKVDLESIKADANLKDILYNRVCFNEYKIKEYSVIKEQNYYLHSGVSCYYINTNDLPEDLENADLTIFEETKFSGFLDDDDVLTKIGNRFGAKEFNTYNTHYKELLPICRVNDEDSDYCISTYWKVGDGFSETYAIINLLD